MEVSVAVSNDNKNVTPYETINAIKKSGFNNVFLQWYEGEYKKFEVPEEEQLEYARKLGLNVTFLHLGYRNVNLLYENGLNGEFVTRNYLKNIDECYKYNVPMIVMHLVHAEDGPKPNKVFLERIKRICSYAKERNIIVAFENTKIKGYQEWIIDNIKDDNVGICFDSGHYHCHFNDEFDFKKFKNKIMCIHLHDNNGKKDEHLLPFDGNLDFDKVLNGLNSANYDSYLTLELCYRNEYLNKMSIDEFYKEGYERGLKLKNRYEEIRK